MAPHSRTAKTGARNKPPPQVFHGTDDGLSTFVDVHVLNDDALLAAMPEPGESFHLRRVGAQKLQRKRSVRIIRGMTRDLYDPSLHPAVSNRRLKAKGRRKA